MLAFFQTVFTFYHQGFELAKDFDHYKRDLQINIQNVRKKHVYFFSSYLQFGYRLSHVCVQSFSCPVSRRGKPLSVVNWRWNFNILMTEWQKGLWLNWNLFSSSKHSLALFFYRSDSDLLQHLCACLSFLFGHQLLRKISDCSSCFVSSTCLLLTSVASVSLTLYIQYTYKL